MRGYTTIIFALALAVTLAAGCGGGERNVGSEAEGWSTPADGLQTRVEIAPGPHRAGGEVPLKLRFRNVSGKDVRVYMVQSEPFRLGSSTLYVLALADKSIVSVQPEPQPHGYVVTEKDFPVIPPGGERAFTQTLRLTDPAFEGGGAYAVRWRYENTVEYWPGGRATLDGATKELFGGDLIPDIWLGDIEATARLEVAPAK